MGRVCHGPSLLWAEMSRNREDKGADQLLVFTFVFATYDSTIPLLFKYKISCHLLGLYSLVYVEPGLKPQRHVFM